MVDLTESWQDHKSRLRNYIARRVGDTDVVDDILQDVFLKAHTNLHTVRSRGSIPAWLYHIAANAIADHYRSMKPRVALPVELAAPEPQRDHVAELATCLQPLISELPEAYRLALVMSEIEGLPQKEVASRLGITLSGAKSRVQRGRDMLRRRLLDCCDVETGRAGIVGYTPRDRDCDGCG
jgi:RNA polymerase sigma-70 factor, ECF subfamily